MLLQRYRAAAALFALMSLTACAPAAGHPAAGASAPSASASPSAPPVAAVPQVGQCYKRVLHGVIMQPVVVDCAQPHQSEIAYVARFDGEPPLPAADAECRTRTPAYVGLPLGRRGATYSVGVGAGWYACEAVFADPAPNSPEPADVQGTHAGGQNAPRPHCYNNDHGAPDLVEVPCAGPHGAEFAAALSVPFGTAPVTGATIGGFKTACRDEIAAQLGITPARVDAKWGYVVFGDEQGTWTGSAPVVPCYIVVSDGNTQKGAVLKG